MLRRIGLRRGFLLAALVWAPRRATTSRPRSPAIRLSPGARPPVTREVIVPPAPRSRARTFTGFTAPTVARWLPAVANQFAASCSARTLLRTARAFPRSCASRRTTRTARTRCSAACPPRWCCAWTRCGPRRTPVTLRFFQPGAGVRPGTRTYDVASDTGGVRTPWRSGRHARRAAGSAEYTRRPPATRCVVTLDSAGLSALRDTTGFGIVLDAATAGARLQINGVPRFAPGSARPTRARHLVEQTRGAGEQPSTFVFTPSRRCRATPSWPAGSAPRARSSRSALRTRFPGARPPQTCAARGAARRAAEPCVAAAAARPGVPAFALADTACSRLHRDRAAAGAPRAARLAGAGPSDRDVQCARGAGAPQPRGRPSTRCWS
jgi:hypothetical protein